MTKSVLKVKCAFPAYLFQTIKSLHEQKCSIRNCNGCRKKREIPHTHTSNFTIFFLLCLTRQRTDKKCVPFFELSFVLLLVRKTQLKHEDLKKFIRQNTTKLWHFIITHGNHGKTTVALFWINDLRRRKAKSVLVYDKNSGVVIIAKEMIIHNRSIDIINWNATQDIKIHKEVLLPLDGLSSFCHYCFLLDFAIDINTCISANISSNKVECCSCHCWITNSNPT